MLVVQRSSGRSGGCLPTVGKAPGACLVVIPRDVRKRLGIRPGQQIRVMSVGDRLELVPVESMGDLRGAFRDFLPELQAEGRVR